MSLHERIRAAVHAGLLQDSWTTGDLLKIAGFFEGSPESSLRTQPPNRSVSLPGLGLGTGANVLNGAEAPFLRVGMRGRAMLYSVRDRAGDAAATRPSAACVEPPGPGSDSTAVEVIVESDVAVGDGAGAVAVHLPASRAREALVLLVRQMQQEKPWDERLRGYNWKKCTFEETQHSLADIMWQGSMLSRLVRHGIEWNRQDKVQAVIWAAKIFEWGGTRQKSAVTWQKVRQTLANAVSGQVEYPDAPMNSGYTKVASFATAYLEEETAGIPQVINDSRVATSLTWRLDTILQEHGWLPADLFPGLGRIDAARGGTRPRRLALAWPDAYQRWSGQFAATSAVLAIRDILNGDSRFPKMPFGERDLPWTVRGVEAVLFMDGY